MMRTRPRMRSRSNMRSSPRFPLLLFLCAIVRAVWCQSTPLVTDPGFEQRTDCPKHYTRPNEALPLTTWYLATKGTADLFTPCARSQDVSVPLNLFGHQEPRSGSNYVGFGAKDAAYVEYVQTRLARALRKGRTYEVTLHVSLADHSREGVSGLGALFTREHLITDNTEPLRQRPQVRVDSAVLDTGNWVAIIGRFEAEGGERYLTIGCFPNERLELARAHPPPQNVQPYAYYYLDDVQVSEVANMPVSTAVDREHQLPAPIILHEVLFAHDRWDLSPEAIVAIDAVFHSRIEGTNGPVEVNGYTDDIGDHAHNFRLSEARARAVADRLVELGVRGERIVVHGHGSDHPVADNSTEEGRRANRRVEIVLNSTTP